MRSHSCGQVLATITAGLCCFRLESIYLPVCHSLKWHHSSSWFEPECKELDLFALASVLPVYPSRHRLPKAGTPRDARSWCCASLWGNIGTFHKCWSSCINGHSKKPATRLAAEQMLSSKVLYLCSLRRRVRRLATTAQHIPLSHTHCYSPSLTSPNGQCTHVMLDCEQEHSFEKLSSLRCGSTPSFIHVGPLLESARILNAGPTVPIRPAILIQPLNIIYRRLIHAFNPPSKGLCCCL